MYIYPAVDGLAGITVTTDNGFGDRHFWIELRLSSSTVMSFYYTTLQNIGIINQEEITNKFVIFIR